PDSPQWASLNFVSTMGAYIIALAILTFIWNFIYSIALGNGRPAGDDPWEADTLEWATTSPPQPYNFARIPVVHSARPLKEDVAHQRGARHELLAPLSRARLWQPRRVLPRRRVGRHRARDRIRPRLSRLAPLPRSVPAVARSSDADRVDASIPRDRRRAHCREPRPVVAHRLSRGSPPPRSRDRCSGPLSAAGRARRDHRRPRAPAGVGDGPSREC